MTESRIVQILIERGYTVHSTGGGFEAMKKTIRGENCDVAVMVTNSDCGLPEDDDIQIGLIDPRDNQDLTQDTQSSDDIEDFLILLSSYENMAKNWFMDEEEPESNTSPWKLHHGNDYLAIISPSSGGKDREIAISMFPDEQGIADFNKIIKAVNSFDDQITLMEEILNSDMAQREEDEGNVSDLLNKVRAFVKSAKE